MKLLLIACLTFSADAALSTIRSGPRKQLFNEGFEFGRPASILDLADVEKAFQEMQFLHIRSLQGDSYGGASLQNPGMSLQIPGGMGSLQTFPPTFPATTMSIDIPAQPVSTTPPSTITESSTCITPDLTNSSSVDIVFLLEVETLSGGTAFVDDLAQGMVSSLAASFSLCIPSGNRKLVARNLEESEVTGLKVSDKTGIDEKTCIATTNGASSCEVLNVVLTVFSDEDSSEEAGRQVYDEVIEQLEDGEALKKHLDNDDIVAIRIRQNDGTVDKATIDDTGGESSERSAWTGAPFKATVSVLSILAVSVIAVGVYRKISNRGDDASSDGSLDVSCDSSIVTDDHTAHQTVLSEDTRNPV